MKIYSIIAVVIIAISIWAFNFKKITDCDFKSGYKCELIHGFGVVVPPMSLVTVWFSTDKDNN